MSRMTNREHEEADHNASRKDACYDTALDEYLSLIEPIKQDFECYLDNTPICDVDFKKIKLMVVCVTLMTHKADFKYEDDYDSIDYDFSKELAYDLLDAYGWEV